MRALSGVKSFLDNSLKYPLELSSRLEQLWNCTGANAGELEGEARRLALIATVRSMDAHLILASSPSSFFDVFQEESYWKMIRDGLLEEDAECRKYSIALLKQTVANSSSSSSSLTSAVFSIKSQLRWNTKQWGTFFLLYDTMDEFKMHLLKPQWPQIRTLFEVREETSTSSSCLSFSSSSWVSSWLSVLYRRGLYHRNRSIRRMVMISFLLEFQEGKRSTLKLTQDSEFVLNFVVKAINQTGLHPPFLLMLLEFDRDLSVKKHEEQGEEEKTTSNEDLFRAAFVDNEEEGEEEDLKEKGTSVSSPATVLATTSHTSSLQTRFFIELRRGLVSCFSSLISTNSGFLDELLQLLRASIESPSAVLFLHTAIQLASSSSSSSFVRIFSPLTLETICDLLSSDRLRSGVLNKPLQTSLLSFLQLTTKASNTNVNFLSRFLSSLDFSYLVSQAQHEPLVNWLYKESSEWYFEITEVALNGRQTGQISFSYFLFFLSSFIVFFFFFFFFFPLSLSLSSSLSLLLYTP
jgi:hypothetical protein